MFESYPIVHASVVTNKATFVSPLWHQFEHFNIRTKGVVSHCYVIPSYFLSGRMLYSESHEYLDITDGNAKLGITDHAQVSKRT